MNHQHQSHTVSQILNHSEKWEDQQECLVQSEIFIWAKIRWNVWNMSKVSKRTMVSNVWRKVSYMTIPKLPIHRRLSQTGDKAFKCLVIDCCKSFTSKKYLTIHQENEHKNSLEPEIEIAREEMCKECNRILSSFGNYMIHLKMHKSKSSVLLSRYDKYINLWFPI